MRVIALLSTLSSLAAAAKLSVQIPGSSILPNPAILPPSTHAVLIGPPGVRLEAELRRDALLTFDNVAPASYLLTIHAHDYSFAPMRVDITQGEASSKEDIAVWQTFRGNEWSNKGPQYGADQGELTIQVSPHAQKEFYQARGGFNLLGFLKSPMILMALGSAVLIFGMPYLMENMDPEMKAEFEEMQKSGALSASSGAADKIQNFDLAGFLSGAGKTSEQPAPPAAEPVKGSKKK